MSVNNPYALCVWPGFCLISIKVCSVLFCSVTFVKSILSLSLCESPRTYTYIDFGSVSEGFPSYFCLTHILPCIVYCLIFKSVTSKIMLVLNLHNFLKADLDVDLVR